MTSLLSRPRVRASQGPSVLVDAALDRRLARDGFAATRLFGTHELDGLREAFLDLRGEGEGFQSDLTIPDRGYRRAADRLVSEAVDERVAAAFDGYEPFLRSFVCKFPGADSSLYLHQDWMYVDERLGARSYVAWIALEDIDHDNGQLQVLRSSHLLDRSVRGTGLTAPWLEHRDVIAPRLSWIPRRSGEAVIFDNALVHCSAPNLTDRPRVAVAVALRPVGTPLVHFRRRDEATATRHDVDADFFLTCTPQGLAEEPPEAPPAEVLPVPSTRMDARTLARRADRPLLARLDQGRRALRQVQGAPAALRRLDLGARLGPTDVRQRIATRITGRTGTAPTDLTTAAAIQVLRLNEALIDRFGPRTPAVWDTARFPWSPAVEAAWPEVRREVEALLHGPTEIPHIEDVTGGIPQGNEGPWRSFVLMHQGRWIDWNCERCPRTTALVRAIPGLTMAGFSVLEPGTHISEHRGPNKGALRYQLGVIVPGEEGDCRIRVGDEMVIWREGEGVAFDFTVPHEAWNDSDAIRVLLMLEVLTPLPRLLAIPNRYAQRAMGWFPTTRDMARRLRALEPSLAKTAAPPDGAPGARRVPG